MSPPKKPLRILLASPRGFCAGVDRAIQIVERAIERYGRPVYVRHEIVHNRYVVENLEAKGAIFVDELDEVPDDRPVVFSAHGVPKAVPAEAGRRNLLYVDATCPLVSKVHREAERHHDSGRTVVLIGHAGHPEVDRHDGPASRRARCCWSRTWRRPRRCEVPDPDNLAYATQTTLSVDDTTAIVAALRRRFPAIQGPKMEDICYATTNRQAAVKAIAPSVRRAGGDRRAQFVELHAARRGRGQLRLPQVAAGAARRRHGLGLAGRRAAGSASPPAPRRPRLLVDELIAACRERYDVTVEEVRTTEESVVFKLPRALVA